MFYLYFYFPVSYWIPTSHSQTQPHPVSSQKTMHNAQDYYHFHGFGSAQEGGGVWLRNHKKCTGWQAIKLNLKTCFICIFIFLCPIGSRPAIPKPNHMILSPHNACIKGQTGPGRGPLWGGQGETRIFCF